MSKVVLKIKGLLKSAPGYFRSIVEGRNRNAGFILYIAVILLLNAAASTLNFRLDLTRNSAYSLSEKSIDLVSNLSSNMKVKVLFSEDLPAEHAAVHRYIRDILDEYEYYGNRFFAVEYVSGDEMEKTASEYGIQPVQSRELVDDQLKIRNTYMGLVIQYTDSVEKISPLADAEGLEYKITSAMEKMSSKAESLQKLDSPLALRLYTSDQLRKLPISGIEKLEETVMEAAEKASRLNYGKIKFEKAGAGEGQNPEELKKAFGIEVVSWNAGTDRNGRYLKPGSAPLGLVLTNGSKHRAIPLEVQPTLFGGYILSGLEALEDSINDAVSTLLNSGLKVGYVTGHGIAGLDDNRTREGAALLKELLSDRYELVPLDLSKDEIPSDVDTLIVNGPEKRMSELELFRIDQHLMRGGSAFVLLDSYIEEQQDQYAAMLGQQPSVAVVDSGLTEMLSSYGIRVNKDIVLDKSCTQVQAGGQVMDYPAIPLIRKEGLSDSNPATAYLNSLLFIKSSSITVDDEAVKKSGLAAKPLTRSSSSSWLMKDNVSFDPFSMMAVPEKDMKPYSLAVYAEGKLKSSFAGRIVPGISTEKNRSGLIKSAGRLDETVKGLQSRLVVVGTSEIASSGFIMDARKILSGGGAASVSGNENFLHGAVDYLTGNVFIPPMMNKGMEYNPLEMTEPGTRFFLKSLNIAGVPILIILTGLLVWRRRNQRKAMIKARFLKEAADEVR